MEATDAIAFKTDRFDYTSDLPAEYNAGNRFYGQDVAAFISERLTAQGRDGRVPRRGLGVLVVGQVDELTSFQVAVYNVNEHGEGGRPGAPEWGLWMRAFERRKLLGLVPKKTEVPVPGRVRETIFDAIRSIGSTPSAWPDGPSE